MKDERERLTLRLPKDLKRSLGRIKELTGKSISSQLIEGAWMAEREFARKLDVQRQTRTRVMNVV